MNAPRVMGSEYMEWAKTCSQTKYNLASSDLLHFPLAELPAKFSDFEITGPGGYGYPLLQEAIAKKSGVDTDCVVSSVGTSLANHIAMAATIGPGDEVLIEHPTYELILSTARYLGASVKTFHRRFENNFQIDVRDVEQGITRKTRLIIITNLHNPSSARTDEMTLRRLGELARSVGARVLVDEVYLDAVFDKRPRPAFQLGSEFITTNSLTKVYGLSGLRCGWILAEPDLARTMWRLTDLFHSSHVHIAELLSVIAFKNLKKITARARSLLDTNRTLINTLYRTRSDIVSFPHESGLVTFPRLKIENTDSLCSLLLRKYDTSVVPGRFFGMPEHIRIAVGQESEMMKAGLTRIANALDEMES